MSKTWKKRTAAQQAADNERARRRRALKAKPHRAARTPRKATAKRRAAPRANGHDAHARTAYRLVDGIPETPRAGTTGRVILETIKAAGQATMPEILQAMPSAPPATVRKWVHMLRGVKAVKSVAVEARA